MLKAVAEKRLFCLVKPENLQSRGLLNGASYSITCQVSHSHRLGTSKRETQPVGFGGIFMEDAEAYLLNNLETIWWYPVTRTLS